MMFLMKKTEIFIVYGATSSAVQERQREKETEFIGKNETIGNWERREREINQEPLRGD